MENSSGLFPSISNQRELDQLLNSNSVMLLYFSTPACSVCQTLKPKLKELLVTYFPSIQTRFVNVDQQAEIAARYRVFTVPVIILFVEGREAIRKSRFINLEEFREEAARIFRLLGS